MRIGWETEWNLAFLCISALQERTKGQRAGEIEREDDNEDDLRKTGMRAKGEGINDNQRDEIKK